jgi:outer membrane receptor protein involved in Fe transport
MALRRRARGCQRLRESLHAALAAWVLLMSVGTAPMVQAAEPRGAPYRFNLPAQGLGTSLEAVALALHQKLLYASELVDGRTAPAIRGEYTLEQALQQLLAGSGLRFELADGLVVIRARDPQLPATGSLGAGEARAAGRAELTPSSATPGTLADVNAGAGIGRLVELQEVIVTGSRIARSDSTSSSPIVTATEQVLREAGMVNIEAALEQMPQFNPSKDENYNAENQGGGGRATVDLRGLGETRTLVLLDGRRMPPSNGSLIANLNDVPLGIVESVEIISGGASAVYGSDAVAGVVNIKTRQHFDGVELQASGGAASGGYGRRSDYALTAGSGFADGNAHALFSVNWTERDQVLGSQRPFFYYGGPSTTLLQFGFQPTPGNLPAQSAYDSLFAQYGTSPGQVPNTTRIGLNDDGGWFSPNAPFVDYHGPIGRGDVGTFTTNTGLLVLNTAPYKLVQVPQNRWAFFTKLSYDLSPTVQAYFQGLYTADKVSTQDNYQFVNAAANLTIPVTNPFIPASLAAILASRPNPTAPFQFTKRYIDLPPTRWDEYFGTWQAVAGLRGTLPLGLDWDLYGLHDATLNTEVQRQRLSATRMQTLLVAADGGSSLCAGGLNPFQGLHGIMSAACADYLTNDLHSSTRVSTTTLEGTLRGGLAEVPAGRVKFALTASARHVDFAYSPDVTLVVGDLGPGSTVPSAGAVTAREFSAEVLVPWIRDRPWAQEWNTTVAARASDYNVTGDIATYKMDTDWHPSHALMFRAGYEHAVRAPNITELFSSPTTTVVQLGTVPQGGDPCDSRSAWRTGPSAAQVRALCVAQGIPDGLVDAYTYGSASTNIVQSGSLSLKPERADTFTIGMVLSPQFDSPLLQNISFSADAYEITIRDAIGNSGYQVVLNKCYNIDGSNPDYSASNPWCQLIDRNQNGPGTSLRIFQPYLNLGAYKTSGVDAKLDWTWRLSGMGLGSGSLHLSGALTYVDQFSVQEFPGAPYLDYAGTVSLPYATIPAVPRIRILGTLHYGWSRFDVGVRWRHVASMADVSTVTQPTTAVPGVPTYNYLDLLASCQLSDRVRLSATVTNLADRDPPVVSGAPGNTQRGLYDLLGRTYLISLRARL